MAKKSIHGIFLAVELDKAALEKVSTDLLQEMEKTYKKIYNQAAIKPRLDSSSMLKSFEGILIALNRVKEHTNNVNQVFEKLPAILSSSKSTLQAQFDAIGKSLDMTGDKFKKIFEQAFQRGEIRNTVSAYEGLRRVMNATKDEMMQMVEQNKDLRPEAVEALRMRYEKTASTIRTTADTASTALNGMLKSFAMINDTRDMDKLLQKYPALSAELDRLGKTSIYTRDQLVKNMRADLLTQGLDSFIEKAKIAQTVSQKTNAQMLAWIQGQFFTSNTPVAVIEKIKAAFRDTQVKITQADTAATNLITKFAGVKEAIQNLKDISKLKLSSTAVTDLASAMGITKSAAKSLLSEILRFRNEKTIIQFFVDLKNESQKSAGEILGFAQKLKLPKDLLDKISEALKNTSSNMRSLSKAAQAAGKDAQAAGQGFSFFNQILMGLGINASIAGLGALIKSAYDTSVKMNTLTVAFQAVEGSSAAASAKLGFIRKESEALGLNFEETAKAAKTFYAAANLSPVAKEGDKIFHAFSEAATALHLSKEETSGMFLAISQMMSKGKITAEELRLQLAERLPGAVQLLAKAMKVSTMELDKMLKDSKVGIENLVLLAEAAHKQYGIAAKNASNSVVAELNRVSNAWFNFKQEFNLAENMAFALSIIKSLINAFTAIGRPLANFAITAVLFNTTGRLLTITLTKLHTIIKGLGTVGLIATFTGATKALVGFSKGALSATTAGIRLAKAFRVLETVKLFGGTAIQAAAAGWATLGVTIAAVTAGLVYWYKSATRASKELQELEKNYENLKKRTEGGINVEIEVNGEKLKKEAVEEQIKKEITAIQDFVKKHKIEMNLKVADAQVELDRLKNSYIDITDEVSRLPSEITKSRKSVEEQVTSYQKLVDSAKQADTILTDFGNTGLSLAKIVRDGAITQETANEKLEEAKNKALEAANGNADLKAQIEALYLSMQPLISQCDAVAVAMGGMAQMARAAKLAFLELGGISLAESLTDKTKSLIRQTQILKQGVSYNAMQAALPLGNAALAYFDKNASPEERQKEIALRIRGDTASLTAAKKYWAGAKTQLPTTGIPGIDVLSRGLSMVTGANAKRVAKSSDIMPPSLVKYITDSKGLPEEAFLEGLKGLDPEAQSYIAKVSNGIKDAVDAAKNYGKALDEFNAAKKPSSGKGDSGKKKKTPKEKSTMAQDKKDRGVDDTLVALKEEKELLERIQKIGEDNTVARSFLEIEQSVIKARKAAAKYEKDNMNATNQAKVAEAAKLMIENAKIKAKTKEIKLLEDEKKKALELISTYNQENGLPDAEGIQLINDAYEKQIRELDSLIEKYEKLGMTPQADIAKKAKETAEKNNEKQLLLKETGVEASVKQALLAYDEANANVTEKMKTLWVDSLTTMGDSLADFISSGLTGFSDLGEAFKELASSMLKDMTRIMMHQFVRYLIQGMFGSSIPFGGGSGGFATGGVLSGGSISSYRNTIVSQPTSFSYGSQRFAKGGIMGEAGPEAVMPLTRTTDGNLGVRSVGSNGNDSGDNVTVNVYNYGNEKAKTRSSKDAHGGRTIDVIIGDIAAQQMTTPGTKLNRTVTAQTGSSQPVIRR